MSSTDRANCWSLTINNPTAEDEEQIALARQKGWKVEGQLETGENGTKHYQLMVRTPQVRFSAVKKAFPRAHIEVARNPSALSAYVTKEQTRTGELPASQNLYPSLKRYWEMIVAELDEMEWLDWDYILNPLDERPDSVWWKHATRRVRQDPLVALDLVTERLIERGYVVEGIATNPATRMSWKKFHAAIIIRVFTDKDRQTDSGVQNGEEVVSQVDIPTTNADDSQSEETSSGLLGNLHGQDRT